MVHFGERSAIRFGEVEWLCKNVRFDVFDESTGEHFRDADSTVYHGPNEVNEMPGAPAFPQLPGGCWR